MKKSELNQLESALKIEMQHSERLANLEIKKALLVVILEKLKDKELPLETLIELHSSVDSGNIENVLPKITKEEN